MPPYIHKRFRRLAIYVSDEACAALPFRQMLSAPLGAYYSSYLKGPSFQGIHSINLYLTSLAAEQGQLEKQVVGYLDYYPPFLCAAGDQSAASIRAVRYHSTGCEASDSARRLGGNTF